MQKKNVKRVTGNAVSKQKMSLGKREKRRVAQLIICVVLFSVVFVGKSISPDGVFQSGDTLLNMIQTDTDFKQVISYVTEVVTEKNTLREWTEKIFNTTLNQKNQDQNVLSEKFGEDGPAVQKVKLSLRQIPTHKTVLEQIKAEQQGDVSPGPTNTPVPSPAPESTQDSDQQTSASPTPSSKPLYTGPALPAGATMEYYELGLGETITPVLGRLTSPYGYRDHPISGQQNDFHAGVDISANLGTPIKAFAAGTIDFVGQSNSYGLYIQVRHANGVTSFYCHCNELCAKKGERVELGQIIAKTGNTGNSTGPHLHLEMKKDGVLINPLHYIQTLK